MVLAFVANFFTNGDATNTLVDHRRRSHGAGAGAETVHPIELPMVDTTRKAVEEEEIDDEAARPPYLHVRMPNTKSWEYPQEPQLTKL